MGLKSVRGARARRSIRSDSYDDALKSRLFLVMIDERGVRVHAARVFRENGVRRAQ